MSEVFSQNIRVQMEKYVESLKSDNPSWSSESNMLTADRPTRSTRISASAAISKRRPVRAKT